jgi:glycosyltransferase involved in cell wall biosynthesis
VFANDDDLWDPDFLKELIFATKENEESHLYFCNSNIISLNNKLGLRVTNQKKELMYGLDFLSIQRTVNYFISRSPIPKVFGMFKREAVEAVLPIKVSEDSTADLDNYFLVIFFAKGFICKFIDKSLFYYRDRPRPIGELSTFTSISFDESVRQIEKYLNHEINFFIESCNIVKRNFSYSEYKFFCCFAFEGLLKYLIDKFQFLLKYYVNHKIATKYLVEFLDLLISEKKSLPIRFEDLNFSPNQKDTSNLVFLSGYMTNKLLESISAITSRIHFYITSNSSVLKLHEFDNYLLTLEKLIFELLESSQILQSESEIIKTKIEAPKISVIVTSLNLCRFVDETIQSILSQRAIDYRILIAEGGSNDGSLRQFERFPEVEIISYSDRGFLDGVHKVLNSISTAFVAICCVSDGYLSNTWLHDATQYLEKNYDISLVWGFPRYMSEDGSLGEISFSEFLYKNTPIKDDMYIEWLRSGFHFPEGNFVCRTEVFRECLMNQDEFEKKNSEGFLKFTSRFHAKGYLSSHIPSIANYGRIHENQSGKLLVESGKMKKFQKQYKNEIRKEKIKYLTNRRKNFVDYKGNYMFTRVLTHNDIRKIFRTGFFNFVNQIVLRAKSKVPYKWKNIIKNLVNNLKK